MKKIFLMVALAAIADVLSAQTQQKNWLLGGDMTFSSDKNQSQTITTFSVSPDVGYFFINNFAGGIRGSYQSINQKDDNFNETISVYSAAPFVRYYFLPVQQKVNLFADASYKIGGVKYDSGSGDGNTTENLNGYSIEAGPAIFFTPHTALEFTLSYSSSKYESDTERTNSFGMGIGFQIHFGGKSVKK